eukprot:TRINITY_DN2585_c0_g1_i6.p1 TRINITY_DN2585_c0_g1~~TRINITY_DN2585_c0_g1_i6.p1  ORF type:complete len:176 (-),score=44.58 TRINITY_DN2585_c0_g1_i6:75-602(-)
MLRSLVGSEMCIRDRSLTLTLTHHHPHPSSPSPSPNPHSLAGPDGQGENKFQIAMKEAPCENYGCFYLTCITCSYGTNWCLRRQVLEKDWSRYYCCQGLSPCCQEQLDNVTPADPNGRACCAWCECCVCPGLAIAATRSHLMICLLYTSDAADEEDSVDLGGRRIIKKKKNKNNE